VTKARKLKSVAEHARDVLIETDNPAVMHGDSGLLDEIACRRWPEAIDWHPLKRWQRVLDSLEGSKLFTKSVYVAKRGLRGNPYQRCFTLIKESA
jgi:hypothetical protein